MPNRQRADNDYSFEVKIGGYNRGSWALMMEIMHEWLLEHEGGDAERIRIVQGILSALESHVADGYDGSSIGRAYGAIGTLTEQEEQALRSVRARREQKKKEMAAFAKELEREKRKQQRLKKAAKAKDESTRVSPGDVV